MCQEQINMAGEETRRSSSSTWPKILPRSSGGKPFSCRAGSRSVRSPANSSPDILSPAITNEASLWSAWRHRVQGGQAHLLALQEFLRHSSVQSTTANLVNYCKFELSTLVPLPWNSRTRWKQADFFREHIEVVGVFLSEHVYEKLRAASSKWTIP